MGSESAREKLKNLEVVAAIANKLDDDLKQLKLWIKTQFESVSFNESESPSPDPLFNRNVTPGPSNYTPNYSLRPENSQITETRVKYVLGECTFTQFRVNHEPDVSPAHDSSVDIISDEDMDPLDPLNHVKLPARILPRRPGLIPNSNQSQLCITNVESSGTSAGAASSDNSAPSKARVTPKNCPFICSICRKRFTTKLSLDKHRDLVQRCWRWNCSKCMRKFKSSEDLKNHTSIYHREAGIKIKKVSSVQEKPEKSIVKLGNPTPSTGQVSPKQKQASTMLQSKNTSKSSFKKLLTPRKSLPGTSNSSQNSNLVRKMSSFLSKSRNMTKSGPKADYKCGECFEIFQDLSQLKVHEKTHIDSMVFRCPIPSCQEVFSSKDDLRLHNSRMHKIKIRHESTRIPGGKVTCRICGGKYISTSIHGHLENIHLACGSVKCERSFEDFQTLWSHKRIHHPRKVTK